LRTSFRAEPKIRVANFADCYGPDFEAPGKATRLLVGLHYLKHAFNEPEESLLDRGKLTSSEE
jgi:hypothetical protein